jgi:hypothetical protein
MAMKNLSKAELLARIKSPSVARRANAVRLLNTAYAMTQREIAKAGHLSLAWVNAVSRWAPDSRGPTTKNGRVGANRKTKSRWASRSLEGRPARLLAYDHPAVVEGRTRYRKTVQMDAVVLKSGSNQRKIGGEILKGHWKGFPVYTLSLEERATCPKTCRHWRSCYGNHMHWPHRMPPGTELERRLEQEVASLADAHPRGFAVRLHVLGDFYTMEYVELWRQLLERHRPLHIWGYTARIDADDPIAAALLAWSQQDNWDRFRMRFSNAPETLAVPSTISVETKDQVPADTTLCPEQEKKTEQERKTESCSTCALCWHSKERIAFRQH